MKLELSEKLRKVLKYWIAGFVISAIILVALIVIFFFMAMFTGVFVSTTQNPDGTYSINGANWIMIGSYVLMVLLVVPFLVSTVSNWVTDKLIT